MISDTPLWSVQAAALPSYPGPECVRGAAGAWPEASRLRPAVGHQLPQAGEGRGVHHTGRPRGTRPSPDRRTQRGGGLETDTATPSPGGGEQLPSCTQKPLSTDHMVTCSLSKRELTWPRSTSLGASELPAGLPGRSAGAFPQTAGTAQTPAPCSPCTGGCPGRAPSATSHTSLWSTRKAGTTGRRFISAHPGSLWHRESQPGSAPPCSSPAFVPFRHFWRHRHLDSSGDNIRADALRDFIGSKQGEELGPSVQGSTSSTPLRSQPTGLPLHP